MHFSSFYCIFKRQFSAKKVPQYAKHATKKFAASQNLGRLKNIL
jgi:hypothetical protein